MSQDIQVFDVLKEFASSVSSKLSKLPAGQPEEQLRTPFENLMLQVGIVWGLTIVCNGEAPLPGRLGRPDYATKVQGLLTGYAELKSPGTGANPKRFTGHNMDQWKRFRAIPNLLYTDGNEWALFRNGDAVGKIVRLSGDVAKEGKDAIGKGDEQALGQLLRKFFAWEPIIPTDSSGHIDLKGLADLIAPLCRMLRDDVADALGHADSPLIQLAQDWRHLLFPEASNKEFADAYAQTVTFALLLGRSEGADPLTLESAESALASQHALLSRALQVLTDPRAQQEISTSLDLMRRLISVAPVITLSGAKALWLYFYEDFLAAYDPKLRKDAGAYYTPVEVVHTQVRLVDDLLSNRFDKPLGFADASVVTLDPAVGTGTYLLGIIEHALGKVASVQGDGAIPGQATTLAQNTYGFETMVGPYAVAEMRVTRALRDHGATLIPGENHIYLTDTLESPHASPAQMPFFLQPIAEQHERALEVKSKIPVLVCLGNPPYDRHEAVQSDNKAKTGGWVRWGDDEEGRTSILHSFLDPVVAAGLGVHMKWLYNSYVYFWRWALWKVFEQGDISRPGIVSFITAASYLFGDTFVGMREHMRRVCDEIWILDLGGGSRGGRKDDNVFAIRTPVAIAIAVRYSKVKTNEKAIVHYARIEGARKAKLVFLDKLKEIGALEWVDCPDEWQASFLPPGSGKYFQWPIIRDLFPWQHSGLMLKRTWPIAQDPDLLAKRWDELLSAPDRSEAFRGSGDREVDGGYHGKLTTGADIRPIADLPAHSPAPPIVRYAFRSFDRQWLIADNRLIARPRTELWDVHGNPDKSRQLYLVSQLWQVLGKGPALTACPYIPDYHYFKGSNGGRDVVPVWRDSAASEPNIAPGWLEVLKAKLGEGVSFLELVAYVYGILSQPAFTRKFTKELETREIRVPITRNAQLFKEVSSIGAQLL